MVIMAVDPAGDGQSASLAASRFSSSPLTGHGYQIYSQVWHISSCLHCIMEVLGAVASGVALAQVSAKGLNVLRKLRDVGDDFAALGQEVS
jgi:hypothetical protein